MPKILIGIVIVLLLVPAHKVQAQGEVVFSIADKPCYKAEFEQLLMMSGTSDKTEALNAVINFKLKVHHAKQQGIDTTKVFRLKMLSLWQDVLCDTQMIGSSIPIPMVDYTLYTIRMQQHGSKISSFDCGKMMNDVFASLEKGVNVRELCATFPLLEREERLSFTLDELMPEVEAQLRQLNIGEFSHPFSSAMGMHIVCKHHAKEGNVEMIHKPVDSSFLQLKKETEEALLAQMITDKLTGKPIELTEDEILEFFIRNKKRYEWDNPRFYGVVIHGKNKKVVKKVKKILSGKQDNNLEERVSLVKSLYDGQIIVDSGLFEFGENAAVDKFVFKQGKGEVNIDYPYSAVVGAKLRPEDVDLSEVKDAVVRDCKRVKELDVFKEIRALYDVEINQEVLKTVNFAVIK